ncbi:hypothetical protein ACJMK2_031588 [Sinanodonta woodiana]|uniref:Mitochondria-eating protein n=1 Tax=Sinanodonta woodiana TaxID=1069815 RepID=A0ABD3WZ91_SINWO
MISTRMSKRPEQSSSGPTSRGNDTNKDTWKKEQNGGPLKITLSEAGQQQENTSEETECEEKILPMSDREEKMINYREQVEEMRKKIKALEDANRVLELRITKEDLMVPGVEAERKGSIKRHLPWRNERPKTAIYPTRHSMGPEITEPSKQLDDCKSQIRQLHDENAKLGSERDALETRLKQLENELYSVKEENRKATETISKLTKEKDDIHKRFSEIVTDRLTHDNTDIVDLSDEHRPVKLSEKMAEIYNYQWTEALDELQDNGFKEGDTVQLLLKILIEAHLACKEVTWNRYLKVTEECSRIKLPWQLESEAKGKENGVVVNVDLTLDQKRHIKQICFGTSKGVESKIRTILIKVVEVKTNIHVEHMKKTRKYLEDCIELCWRMTMQEKPMYLDTSVAIQDGQKHFDNEKFRSYTKTGQYVDFVVWPALYLFEGGPLIERGIAQGSHETESQSVSKLDD